MDAATIENHDRIISRKVSLPWTLVQNHPERLPHSADGRCLETELCAAAPSRDIQFCFRTSRDVIDVRGRFRDVLVGRNRYIMKQTVPYFAEQEVNVATYIRSLPVYRTVAEQTGVTFCSYFLLSTSPYRSWVVSEARGVSLSDALVLNSDPTHSVDADETLRTCLLASKRCGVFLPGLLPRNILLHDDKTIEIIDFEECSFVSTEPIYLDRLKYTRIIEQWKSCGAKDPEGIFSNHRVFPRSPSNDRLSFEDLITFQTIAYFLGRQYDEEHFDEIATYWDLIQPICLAQSTYLEGQDHLQPGEILRFVRSLCDTENYVLFCISFAAIRVFLPEKVFSEILEFQTRMVALVLEYGGADSGQINKVELAKNNTRLLVFFNTILFSIVHENMTLPIDRERFQAAFDRIQFSGIQMLDDTIAKMRTALENECGMIFHSDDMRFNSVRGILENLGATVEYPDATAVIDRLFRFNE